MGRPRPVVRFLRSWWRRFRLGTRRRRCRGSPRARRPCPFINLFGREWHPRLSASTCGFGPSRRRASSRSASRGQFQLPLRERFYVPSSGLGQRLKLAKQLSGDMALEASFDVADGLALGEATLHVLLCGAVLTHAVQHDGVERAVELSISRPVRCRVMVPDDASMGAAPPSLAKAASERMRRCATRR
jgi:hypothetical protein